MSGKSNKLAWLICKHPKNAGFGGQIFGELCCQKGYSFWIWKKTTDLWWHPHSCDSLVARWRPSCLVTAGWKPADTQAKKDIACRSGTPLQPPHHHIHSAAYLIGTHHSIRTNLWGFKNPQLRGKAVAIGDHHPHSTPTPPRLIGRPQRPSSPFPPPSHPTAVCCLTAYFGCLRFFEGHWFAILSNKWLLVTII